MMTIKQFAQSFPLTVPLVILHPNAVNQRELLPMTLNLEDRTPLFVSLQTHDLPSAWMLLAAALSDQAEVKLPALDGKSSAEKAAQAVLTALKPIGNFTLVIDAFDLADDAVSAWIGAMVKSLP